MIPDAHIVTFKAEGLRSLAWDGNELVDWAGGGTRYTLDGRTTTLNRTYAYGFDAAVAFGKDAVIFKRAETKGLVLRDGEILREINRSFYCAQAFDYPVTMTKLSNGRLVIIHCPERADQIEIDDFATGERLTAGSNRAPRNNFHGRLSTSPDGRYLLSAGWVWQPMDDLLVFDLEDALANPAHLDGNGILPAVWSETGASASFTADGRMLAGINVDDEDSASGNATCLRVFDLSKRAAVDQCLVSGFLGRLMAVGTRHVLNLYCHPQLLEVATGKTLSEWPEIFCDDRVSATYGSETSFAHVAIDAQNSRVAIGRFDRITVMAFNSDP